MLAAAPSELELSRARAALGSLPLRFEANQGQWKPEVRYAARAGGYNLLLTSRGPSLSVPGSKPVEIGLLNSNPVPRIEALDPLPAHTDYFLGGRTSWHTGVPNYSRVRYGSVYPGIDLVYYGSRDRLEYDFVLQPGADPSAIRLKFRGPGRISITPDGDLTVDAEGSRMLQKRPVVYQDGPEGRREIAGRYKLLGRNTVGLAVAGYDRARPLVIDPILFCTYVGGSGTDEITAMKLDSKGRLYVTGWTTTGDLTAIDGAYNNVNAGQTDIFIAILDTTTPNLAPVYFSYLGGSALDVPLAMDVDSAGVVYLTGTTTSTNFPTAGNAAQTTGAATAVDAFVVKLDPSQYGGASLLYSSYLGGSTGNESGNGIAVGKDGMIYVIGTTRSTDFPVTGNAYASSLYGTQDAFLVKVDPGSTALAYSTYLGGELDDDGRAIAVDKNGLVYFGITTDSTQFPYNYGGPAPYRASLQGGLDTIVGVMDMTKAGTNSLVWDTYFGGSANDEVRKIALDAKGNVLVTGYTLSPDFPVTQDALRSSYGGNGNVFVSVLNPLNPSSFVVYSTYLGGSGGEVAYDILSDAAGSICVTGYTLSPDFPVTKDAVQSSWGGGIDVFFTRFKPGVAGNAALQTSTYLGPTGVFVPLALAVAQDGTVYVGGYSGLGMPSSSNGNGYGGGLTDGFVVVMGTAPPAGSASGSETSIRVNRNRGR
jgi:hypothetical protein